ncbi:MAG: hypothetical protein ABSA67_14250 [Candidatus Brocadiia bacterium]|jgi:hypothetical protein
MIVGYNRTFFAYTASGAGSANANVDGNYARQSGTHDGQNYWMNSNGIYLHYNSTSGRWVIDNTLTDQKPLYEASTTGTALSNIVGSWTFIGCNGQSPAPTVVAG